MRNRVPKGRRRGAAALAGALAVALLIGSGAGVWAADDDEEVPWDTKIMRRFLKDLGLQRDGEQIEYRERAPLVVPPSRALPPPRDAGAVTTSNPAWPNDPDVKARKAAVTNKKKLNRTAAEAMEAEGRPLSRSELEVGRVPPGTDNRKPQSPEESARPMRPSELGSKGIFSDLFSTFRSDKTEVGTFTGEPVRESLTAPPPGYQTPSPNQPYGVGPQVERHQPAKPEDRLTGGR
jgi:hypothetical protein